MQIDRGLGLHSANAGQLKIYPLWVRYNQISNTAEKIYKKTKKLAILAILTGGFVTPAV